MERDLEGGYRRLMAAYPQGYRHEYEDEMVGVLLSAATPGQRRPGVRERADLIANALAVRLRGVAGGRHDERWRQAARAMQAVVVMLLLIATVRRAVLGGVYGMHWEVQDILRPALWAVTLTVLLSGWRRVTVLAAVAAAAVEVVHVAPIYTFSPSQVLMSSWLVVSALLVAVLSGWLATGPPTALPRVLGAFAGSMLLGAGATFVDVTQGEFFGGGDFSYAVTMDGVFVFRFAAPMYLAAVALGVWAWWRQGGPVRRRMLALAAVPAGLALMVSWGFAGFMTSSQRFRTPVYLEWFQWVILALTPLAAFAVAALALNRYERVATLVALGRQAEQSGTPERHPASA